MVPPKKNRAAKVFIVAARFFYIRFNLSAY